MVHCAHGYKGIRRDSFGRSLLPFIARGQKEEFIHAFSRRAGTAEGRGPDPEENARRGVRFIREAKALGADLVLFPEMWSNAYAPPFEEAFDDPFRPGREEERRRWREQAVSGQRLCGGLPGGGPEKPDRGVRHLLSAGDPRPATPLWSSAGQGSP